MKVSFKEVIEKIYLAEKKGEFTSAAKIVLYYEHLITFVGAETYVAPFTALLSLVGFIKQNIF